MVDDPTEPPEPPRSAPDNPNPPPASPPGEATLDAGAPAVTPARAAADQPASTAPGEPLTAEVSRTDSPGAGASAAPDSAPTTPAAKPAVVKPPAGAALGAGAAAKPPAKPALGAEAAVPKAPAAKAAVEHAPKAAPPTGPPDQPPPADKTAPAFIATLQTALPDSVLALSYWVGDWTIIVAAAKILEVARHLREAPDAAFDLCSDVTTTDWPLRSERFDMIYCLYSTRHRHRVRVKTKVAEDQPFPSVTAIWPAADWLEREIWDMFGVNFTGHPDRRRILMPEDWQGHPQRKDYPLEGPGELLMENPLDWLKLRQAREEADIE
jgi:NADH-quinone oxidoreductase subunit C